ncbi:MAG TPA: hypothetical protein VFV86_12930 [Nitrososphaeraceae archaeon]|nr:hypothetical protein [Nitrososphaeraceae archaeon]
MDKKIKRKWINALRSRKYKQTQECLRYIIKKDEKGNCTYGYCCLGVLCDIVDKKGWSEVSNGGYNGHDDFIYKDKASDIDLPENLLADIKLSKEEMHELVHMNDSGGKKFYQIAKWIEKNL